MAWPQQSAQPVLPPLEPAAEAYSVLIWAGLIIFAAVLLAVSALAIRKRLMRPEEPDPGGGMGFTLADLRTMHQRGYMTDDEFDRAKRRLIANARSGLDEETDPEPGEIHLEGEPDGDEDGNDGDPSGR